MTEAFPYEQVEEKGYNILHQGQKTYNGVAILSKGPLEDTLTKLPGDDSDEQARFVEALTTLDGEVYRVASVYVPNGQAVGSEKFAYKLAFLERLHQHLAMRLGDEEMIVYGGDYNVAPAANDVYAPDKLDGTVCFHADERRMLRSMLHDGLIDAWRAMHPADQHFSWWDYRGGSWPQNKGMRIDHLLLSPQAADQLVSSGITSDVRGWEKASDHAPVWAELQRPNEDRMYG